MATMLSAVNAVPGLKTPAPVRHNSSTLLPKYDVGFYETPGAKMSGRGGRRVILSTPFAVEGESLDLVGNGEEREDEEGVSWELSETRLNSFSPLPLLLVAALPGAGVIRSAFAPFVELVKSWNLPDWLVHWGHPANMAVVLFAMGGYGTYLGFRIRFSDNVEEKAKAKDLHPKLLAGMFFFFALGATGGVTSLLTSDKPILER
uniref:Uncharacterized protein n=1 Tax=Kalanchoe fedtschenkoi TaxID=63787 RepID=A0A7N0VFU4_KALFE